MKIEEIGNLNIYISDGNYSSKYPRSNEFVKEGIPFIRANNFKNHTILNTDLLFINKEKHATLKKGHLKTGDVLITTRGNIGNTVLVPSNHNDSNINAQIVLLRPDASIDSKYLMIIFQLPEVQKQITALTTGTALKQLPVGHLKKIKIPVPDILTQLHIASILTKAENLIAQRKESIRLLDEFLKSTFLEMFGDPLSNKNEFSTVPFGDYIIKIIAGSSYGGEQKDTIQPDEYGVLKVSAVTWGVFNPKEFKIVNKKDIKGGVIHPIKGDLLFSRANTKELVGATCIVDADYPKLFLPDKLWNIKLNESKLNKIFIHHLFKDKGFKNSLTLHATGTSGSMLNISMEKLRKVKFAIPPIELQNRFAKIVEKTGALKTQYQQSLRELENLYGSLSQRAFKGELSFKDEKLMMAAEPEEKYSK